MLKWLVPLPLDLYRKGQSSVILQYICLITPSAGRSLSLEAWGCHCAGRLELESLRGGLGPSRHGQPISALILDAVTSTRESSRACSRWASCSFLLSKPRRPILGGLQESAETERWTRAVGHSRAGYLLILKSSWISTSCSETRFLPVATARQDIEKGYRQKSDIFQTKIISHSPKSYLTNFTNVQQELIRSRILSI